MLLLAHSVAVASANGHCDFIATLIACSAIGRLEAGGSLSKNWQDLAATAFLLTHGAAVASANKYWEIAATFIAFGTIVGQGYFSKTGTT